MLNRLVIILIGSNIPSGIPGRIVPEFLRVRIPTSGNSPSREILRLQRFSFSAPSQSSAIEVGA